MCIKSLNRKDIDLNNRNTILELFDFYEEELYKNTDENIKLMKDILKIENPFYENLTSEQRKQYEELTDLRELNSIVTDRKIFVFAFSLGINLISESKIF